MLPEDLAEVPTIFTGVPRSGTTLLGDLANRYLDVAAVNEGTFEFWLADQNCDEAHLQDDHFYDRLLARLARHLYFQFLYGPEYKIETVVKQLKPMIAVRSLPGIAQGVLRLTAQRWGGRRLGHEDPLLIDDLHKVYWVLPNCRIVHIVRDPRDVAVSILRFPWGANNVVIAALDWNRKVKEARRLGKQLGNKRYLEIRYEDLLQEPRQTMASLMTFVTGQVDNARLEQFVQEVANNPRRHNFGLWRTQLSTRQAQAVEACAHEQMTLSGYQREKPPISVSWPERVLWKAHHRVIQIRNILKGELAWNGAGKIGLDPTEPA